MRSEADIRSQVEARFRRWIFLLLNGGAWAAVAFGLYLYARFQDLPVGWRESAAIVMLMWAAVVGVHALRVFYVEGREFVVRRAIERERRYYVPGDAYEKRKHDDALPRLSEDGELIDFPDEAKAEYERRS